MILHLCCPSRFRIDSDIYAFIIVSQSAVITQFGTRLDDEVADLNSDSVADSTVPACVILRLLQICAVIFLFQSKLFTYTIKFISNFI